MFRALDENGATVLAEQAAKGEAYYCPVCGERLKLRKGPRNAAHFAHHPEQPCPYNEDRDYMSEWHVRMQGHFPPESRERYFKDAETGEIHRADVFLEDCNTVIEFQESHMTPEEFLSRTRFHLKEGRRIAWVFNESRENPKPGDFGKLRFDNTFVGGEFPHGDCSFKWLNHRKCLPYEGDPLDIKMGEQQSDYAVLVYTGADGGDVVRRIIHEEYKFEYILLSIARLEIGPDFEPDDPFRDEEDVIARSEIRDDVYAYREKKREDREFARATEEAFRHQQINAAFGRILKTNRRW